MFYQIFFNGTKVKFEKYFLQLNGNYSSSLTLFHFMDSIRMKLKIYFTVYVRFSI